MAVTHEDVQELKTVFDGRYVLQSTCNSVQENVNKKFSNDKVRIELLAQQQKINNWLTTGIAGGIVALLIKVFIGG